MLDVVVNPPGIEEHYLAWLNQCFPGWGGHGHFEWAFRRQVGGPPADLMVIRSGGQVVAGSAVTYRRLRVPGRGESLVGIMTGSWTLPAARGQGCFSRIIEESIDAVKRRDGAFLLAFVTETNASSRRLAAAGAAMVPTRYVVSPETTANTASAVRIQRDAGIAASMLADLERGSRGKATFVYTPPEWESQFLARPGTCYVARVDGLGACVVEEHGDFDRLQAIVCRDSNRTVDLVRAMRDRAVHRGRRIFFFSTDCAMADQVAEVLGLVSNPGSMTLLCAAETAMDALYGGSHPDDARALTTDTSPHFLGPVALQSGDRM